MGHFGTKKWPKGVMHWVGSHMFSACFEPVVTSFGPPKVLTNDWLMYFTRALHACLSWGPPRWSFKGSFKEGLY